MITILISQEAEVKICNANVKHYKNLGYKIPENNSTDSKEIKIIVKVEDLPPNSMTEVQVKCDYCGEIILKKYNRYLNSRKIIKKDACSKCRGIKQKEISLILYGVDSVLKLPEIRQKIYQTNIKKYGVPHVLSNKEIKQKALNTCLDKYGTYYPAQKEEVKIKQEQTNMEKYGTKCSLQNEIVKQKTRETCLKKYGAELYTKTQDFLDKVKKTNLEKYGVEYTMQLEEFRIKSKNTFLKKYGVDSPMKVREIKEKAVKKAIKTASENGIISTSRVQLYLNSLLNGELNYPVDTFCLDIAFPEEMIYIEYDGGGHNLKVKLGLMAEEEFKRQEIKRYYYLKQRGWKQIKIISKKDKIPQKDKVLEMIKIARNYLNTGHSWIEFDIDNKIINCSQFKKEYDFGELINRYRLKKKFKGDDNFETISA